MNFYPFRREVVCESPSKGFSFAQWVNQVGTWCKWRDMWERNL